MAITASFDMWLKELQLSAGMRGMIRSERRAPAADP
jgi:hypothetical protein